MKFMLTVSGYFKHYNMRSCLRNSEVSMGSVAHEAEIEILVAKWPPWKGDHRSQTVLPGDAPISSYGAEKGKTSILTVFGGENWKAHNKRIALPNVTKLSGVVR